MKVYVITLIAACLSYWVFCEAQTLRRPKK